MTKSCFAQLHHTLLHRIFSCNTLSFVDKVRSEHVCTAWRAYLSDSSSHSSYDVWGEHLIVHLLRDGIHVAVPSLLREKVLSSPKNYLSGKQKSFVEWLAKRAAGFRKVYLHSIGDKGYRTASLLLALYNSGRSNSFGPELFFNTGSSFLLEAPATCQLITGMLIGLTCSAYAVELGLQNIATCARLEFCTYKGQLNQCILHRICTTYSS